LYGGSGRDTFVLTGGSGYDRIQDFNRSQDRIELGSGLSNIRVARSGRDALVYAGRDLLARVRGAANQLRTSDLISSSSTTQSPATTTTPTRSANDGTNLTPTRKGTNRSQYLRGSSSRNDVITGEGGNDRIYGYGGNDTLLGGSGNDHIYGHSGNDTLNGGSGNDCLSASTGNDVLLGGSGNDRLYGSSGNDKLVGGAGYDRLYGGSGSDTFVLTKGSGYDRIMDFRNGQDRIEIGSSVDSLSIRNRGRNANIYDGSDLLAVVQNGANQLQQKGEFLV